MAINWTQVASCAQLAASSGTGAFVLSAMPADGGYNVLTADNDGELLFYAARPTTDNAADNESEEGSGIYTHSTRTIARTNIYQSTNSDSVVDFTNAPIVYPVFGSELIRRLDLVLNLSGGGTAAAARTALGVADSDIQSLIDARIAANWIDTTGLQTGETVVWNGSQLVRATAKDPGEFT
jgi:hypothetical protein